MSDIQRAIETAEFLLAETGRALMTGDFALFHQYFLLPQKLETFDGERIVETLRDLQDLFDNVRGYYARTGVTDIERRCVAAAFKNSDTIEATHDSRLLAGSNLIQAPYAVFSVLQRVDGIWKISDSKYAVIGSLSQAMSGETQNTDPA